MAKATMRSKEEPKEDKAGGKFVSLPTVESIRNKKERNKVIDLLEEGNLIKASIDRESQRLDEIKDELLLIQEELELPGFRNGRNCFAATWRDGKRSLNKELLIENGVTPEQIQAGYKQGEGYWSKDLKFLDE